MKKDQSRFFIIENEEPHQDSFLASAPISSISLVAFSGVQRIAEITGEELQALLAQFLRSDPSLPSKPPPAPREESDWLRGRPKW